MKDKEKAKIVIHKLYNSLMKHEDQTNELLDVTDVLFQVYGKLDTTSHDVLLINKLVNYIRSVSVKGRIKYSSNEEEWMIELGEIGKKAGSTGLYLGNFSDKSQFYSYFDREKLVYRND